MTKKTSSKSREKRVDYQPLAPGLEKRKRGLLSQPVQAVSITEDLRAADLVEAMAGMAIQARNIGRCAQVLSGMYADPKRPTVLMGLAGPLVAAGLRKVLRELVDSGAVAVVV